MCKDILLGLCKLGEDHRAAIAMIELPVGFDALANSTTLGGEPC